MLHIHNGDSSADTARKFLLAGEHLAWRESLITGPTPAGLSEHEWRSVRARHLSAAYGVDFQQCERELLDEDLKLLSFKEHQEVTLWFEHDLFCQTNLLYLLNWFAHQDTGNTRLSLICIGEFPGKENFRGLGELNGEELTSLLPGRQQVTEAQLKLAELAWQAYCSPEPTEIEKVLRSGTSPLAFLGPALQAHLRRFPATKNGLGRIENCILELVHDGLNSFSELFTKSGEAEPVYGLGDAQFWLAMQQMAAAGKPLLNITGIKSEPDQQALTREVVSDAKFEMTELGESVLKGEADFISVNGIDLWLGGVHLHDRSNLWRWDEQSQAIVFARGKPV